MIKLHPAVDPSKKTSLVPEDFIRLSSKPKWPLGEKK